MKCPVLFPFLALAAALAAPPARAAASQPLSVRVVVLPHRDARLRASIAEDIARARPTLVLSKAMSWSPAPAIASSTRAAMRIVPRIEDGMPRR